MEKIDSPIGRVDGKIVLINKLLIYAINSPTRPAIKQIVTASIKNCPRICDIDIIDFKGLNLKTNLNGQKIVTPHPRMHNRNFVLFPLFELNKRWIHPKTKQKINELINRFNNMDFSDIRIVKNK